MPGIDFRISRPVSHEVPGVASVRYRAGFEDWDRPGAFVVQMEEARGFDDDRGRTAWSPVARFEHRRPHDLFDPAEGIHLDVHRRTDPDDEYRTVDLGVVPARRNPRALFFALQRVFEVETNVALLLEHYVGRRENVRPAAITLPEGPLS